MYLRAEAFLLFLFKAEVEEVNEKDFENDIIVRKFDWICDNLLEFKNHLMSKQIVIIPQFEKIENLI